MQAAQHRGIGLVSGTFFLQDKLYTAFNHSTLFSQESCDIHAGVKVLAPLETGGVDGTCPHFWK